MSVFILFICGLNIFFLQIIVFLVVKSEFKFEKIILKIYIYYKDNICDIYWDFYIFDRQFRKKYDLKVDNINVN